MLERILFETRDFSIIENTEANKRQGRRAAQLEV